MITPKEKRFLKYWEDQKDGGKWQYILVYTIGWSIILFIVPLAFSFVFDMYTAIKMDQPPLWAAITAAVILGITLSFFIWHRNEKKYRRISAKKLSETSL